MNTPWHLWVVGIFAVLFNAGGAFDYVMTQTANEAYMSQFSADEIAWFNSFPWWVEASWAIAVWSAVVGGLLLLLRSRFAVTAFAVSLVGMAVTFIHNFLLSEPPMYDVVGQEAVWVTAVIVAVTLVFFHYSRAMGMRGVLR